MTRRLKYPNPPKRAAKEPRRLTRGARPRAKRKGGRAALKRRCDKLWSQIIRASNGGRCKLAGQDHVRCGGPIQAAHLFGRAHHSVRHSLDNGWPLCSSHHCWYSNNSDAWMMLLWTTWGEAEYRRRYREAWTPAKPDYVAIAAELQRILDGTAA